MIRKPQGDDWTREGRSAQAARHFGGTASKALSAGTSAIARGRALYRAFILGIMACMLGAAALAAGLHDGNVPAFIGAGCGSLGLGWLALHNVRTAFARARIGSFGDNRERDSEGSAGWHAAAAGRPASAYNADVSAPRGGQVIRYGRGKLVVKAMQTFALGLLMACLVTFDRHAGLPLRSIILVVLLFALWRLTGFLLLAANKDLTAISWDSHQIRVRTLTTSRQVPWQSVESVESIRRVYRAWGLIPVSSSRELVFLLRHNGSRRRMAVPAAALEIRPGVAEELMRAAALCRAQSAVTIGEAANQRGSMGRRSAADQTLARAAYDRSTFVPRVFGSKVT